VAAKYRQRLRPLLAAFAPNSALGDLPLKDAQEEALRIGHDGAREVALDEALQELLGRDARADGPRTGLHDAFRR
jgi:hypothetical protein